jgi:hypothetical protein
MDTSILNLDPITLVQSRPNSLIATVHVAAAIGFSVDGAAHVTGSSTVSPRRCSDTPSSSEGLQHSSHQPSALGVILLIAGPYEHKSFRIEVSFFGRLQRSSHQPSALGDHLGFRPE